MIIITGALGFVGSCLVSELRAYSDRIVLVDSLKKEENFALLDGKSYSKIIERSNLKKWLDVNGSNVECIIHLGARSDTTESNQEVLRELNLNYSKMLWDFSKNRRVKFIYASSASTYGMGENGFRDDTHPSVLKPLNLYGESKNDFDEWILRNSDSNDCWFGLKFFNVFGPNEVFKGRMASVIHHFYNQARRGKISLFKSNCVGIEDGQQKRDFVYVKDVVRLIRIVLEKGSKENSGIFNVGTGVARSFNDVADIIGSCLDKTVKVNYIPFPVDLTGKYQNYTRAENSKLLSIFNEMYFTTLEDAIRDCIENYFLKNRFI